MKLRREHMFITAYAGILLVLAAMGYMAGDYTVRQQQIKAANSPAAVAARNFATDVGYMPLPRMSMTMTSAKGQGTGRVRIDISLEVEQKNLPQLADYQPLITDRLINYIRKMDIDEMRKPNTVPHLREDLLKQVNTAAYPVPVLDIIFRQFVIM